MPLPEQNTAWPPKPHDQVLTACQERQVWWEGDPIKLAEYYGGQHLGGNDNRFKAAWNSFWKKPTPSPSQPRRLHVPIAADIGRIAASTLFSSPVTFKAGEGDDGLQDTIDLVLNTEEMYSSLLVGAESASMLSGTYGRIVWDQSVSDNTWIDFVDADHAIPTFKWGRLQEVLFWNELATPPGDNTLWRMVMLYAKGKVEYSLYCGDRSNIGKQMPLAAHPDTAGISKRMGGTQDAQTVWFETGDTLPVAYFPNHRPNPQWRNEPDLRHLGRSDLTRDVLALLDACDETWSSWMNDLELGRGRVFISEQLLTSLGPGKGAAFNTETSIYSPVGVAMKDDGMTSILEAQQFEIRVDEHARTFDALFRRAISRAGYSPITFGLPDEVATTATEVTAKERDTNSTRSAKIRLWSSLAHLATAQMQIEHLLTNSPEPKEPVQVDWPDANQESPQQIATTIQLLAAAEAASTETKVRMFNSDWDDKQIQDEVARIEDAKSASVPTTIIGPTESNFGPTDPNAPADQPPADATTDPNTPPAANLN